MSMSTDWWRPPTPRPAPAPPPSRTKMSSPPVEPPSAGFLDVIKNLFSAANPLTLRNNVNESYWGNVARDQANVYAPFTTGAVADTGSAGFGDVAKDLGLLAVGGAAGKLIGAGIGVAAKVAQGAHALRASGMRGLPAYATAAGNLPAAMSVAGKRADEIIEEGGPMQAALLRYLGRHRSTNPLLGKSLIHPKDVLVSSGRRVGPGTYLAQTPSASDSTFAGFGPNIYRFNMGPSVWANTAKSKGYIDERGLKDLGLKFGEYNTLTPDTGTLWSDGAIQKLRGQGYLGFKHGEAFTDWNLGVEAGLGLKRMGTSNNPNLFGARNIFDTTRENIKEGGNSVLDAFSSTFWREDMSALPKFLQDFVNSRTYMRYSGENMPFLRPFNADERTIALLRRLGVNRLFPEKVDNWPRRPPPEL